MPVLGSEDLERRKNNTGLWVHWVGDFISLIAMILALAYSSGKLDERVSNVEKKQAEQAQQASTDRTQAANDRRELKTDVQREFATISDALRSMDQKLTAILMQKR